MSAPTSFNAAVARWVVDGWRGKAPLRPIFWWGGAVWFFGFLIERGLVNMLVRQQAMGAGLGPAMFLALRVTEWVLLGIFIWWCIAVWRCADAEPRGLWPTTAKGIVALLVIGNAVSVLIR